MQLQYESPHPADYLLATGEVDFNAPSIAGLTDGLLASSQDQIGFIRKAYAFVRDEIAHSWDIQSARITCSASETLLHREGICYAKSNLLCAILRRANIPAGFCYQRLTLGDTPDTGYCIHALNAVYIANDERWIRLDARGNKPGIEADFSLGGEKLAFPIRTEYGEVDYPVLYRAPHPKTIAALRGHADCKTMYLHGLPDAL
ncbi:transglutaminase family protein [Paenibacillus lycopersici]|uniref:Transglutaminase family protein n=1 Tax=Paenibacillus lycopersici TaxID=2704462 RepID=A0A6C0FVG4_9BACL|nr:transglutaminase family protein [Paenibacillus lycopersici]QHT60787.1 transglutaminase family protein [Paenibacillus lycopersici]